MVRRSVDRLAQTIPVQAHRRHLELGGRGVVHQLQTVTDGARSDRLTVGGREVEHPQQLRDIDVLGSQTAA